LTVDTFPIDLPYQPQLRHDRQLSNQSPDSEGVRPLSIHSPTSVQVEGERGHPVAHNPGPCKTKPPLFRSRRRQQRSQLHGNAHPLLLLEDALPQDRLQEQGGIDKLGPCIWRLLDASFADELQVLSKTVIHHYLGYQEGILPLCPCERKIP